MRVTTLHSWFNANGKCCFSTYWHSAQSHASKFFSPCLDGVQKHQTALRVWGPRFGRQPFVKRPSRRNTYTSWIFAITQVETHRQAAADVSGLFNQRSLKHVYSAGQAHYMGWMSQSFAGLSPIKCQPKPHRGTFGQISLQSHPQADV